MKSFMNRQSYDISDNWKLDKSPVLSHLTFCGGKFRVP